MQICLRHRLAGPNLLAAQTYWRMGRRIDFSAQAQQTMIDVTVGEILGGTESAILSSEPSSNVVVGVEISEDPLVGDQLVYEPQDTNNSVPQEADKLVNGAPEKSMQGYIDLLVCAILLGAWRRGLDSLKPFWP